MSNSWHALFVPLAEEGWTDHEVTRMIVETYLKPLQAFKPDTLILGCTHYHSQGNRARRSTSLWGTDRSGQLGDGRHQTVRDALVSLDLLSETRLHPNRFFATDVSEKPGCRTEILVAAA